MSFADFLEYWLVNDCAVPLNEITMFNYRKKIKNLIVPYLGKYRINTIDRDKLQNLLITLHDNGYSNNTVSAVKGILTKYFNYAYYSGYIIKTPAISLKIPKTENTAVPTRQSPHVYLTKEQLSANYKYEMHSHTSPCSGGGEDIEGHIDALIERGFSGMVVTNLGA